MSLGNMMLFITKADEYEQSPFLKALLVLGVVLGTPHSMEGSRAFQGHSITPLKLFKEHITKTHILKFQFIQDSQWDLDCCCCCFKLM